MQTPTSDQLRQQIDSGLTGEKVAMPDPAAAPLGTDAEAGGAPPTAAELTMAAKQAPQAPDHHAPPRIGAALYLVLIAAVGCALALIVVLAA